MNRRLLAFWVLAGGPLVLGAVAIAPAVGVADASPTQHDDEEFPRAEAGLDQTVQQNASVLLDATESWSPSGEIADYEWEITTPDGSTIEPDCDSADCGLGRFRAQELGEYEVTVTVEDDDGRRESDTMYVTVVPRGDFGVELTGPTDAAGEEANLTATVAPGNLQVQNLTWYRGDQELGNHSVPAIGGVFERPTFIVPGATYRVVATDQFNRTVNDTWTVPGGSTWTPDSPDLDEFPRIDGPAVITGTYDYTNNDGIWQFDGATYRVRTSQWGTVTDATWGVNNGDSEDYNAHGTSVEPPLDPGMNVIVANVDIELDKLAKTDQAGNNTASNLDIINGTTEQEVVLQRRVVVDPKPEIKSSTLSMSDRQASASFVVEDQYNSVKSAKLTIDGRDITEINVQDGRSSIGGSIPDNVDGEVTLRLDVEDERGQVTTRSKQVTAEVVPSEMEDFRVGAVYPPPDDDGDDDEGEDDSSHSSPPLVPWP